MFSLRDLRFVLCSRDLNVLRTQRIIGFKKNLNYLEINEENPISVEDFMLKFGLARISSVKIEQTLILTNVRLKSFLLLLCYILLNV